MTNVFADAEIRVSCEPWLAEPAPPDPSRTERVEAAQLAWSAHHVGAQDYSPEQVTAEYFAADPARRQGPLAVAFATHGLPLIEARGPGDPEGELERTYRLRGLRNLLAHELRTNGWTDRAYELAGMTVPPGAKRTARNPFA